MHVGCEGGDGRAGFSDLQTEELPLQQAQVAEDVVQQNNTFILLLNDGNNTQKTAEVTLKSRFSLLTVLHSYQNNNNNKHYFHHYHHHHHRYYCCYCWIKTLILAEGEQIESRIRSTAAACFLSHTHIKMLLSC